MGIIALLWRYDTVTPSDPRRLLIRQARADPEGKPITVYCRSLANSLVCQSMSTAFAARKLSNVVPSRATARLRAFRRDVEFALPGKVALVVLFGSRARGDARRDSDYDVAVFVRDLNDRRSIDHTLADTAYRHILAGVHIRPVAVPADYLESRPRDTLAMNIAQDGILVQ